jgi:hypothetical protein
LSEQASDDVRVFILRTSEIRPDALRFRDLLDIADKANVDVMQLEAILNGDKGTGADRLRALAAFTWVTLRSSEPTLTYDDVLDGRVVVEEGKTNPTAEQETPS